MPMCSNASRVRPLRGPASPPLTRPARIGAKSADDRQTDASGGDSLLRMVVSIEKRWMVEATGDNGHGTRNSHCDMWGQHPLNTRGQTEKASDEFRSYGSQPANISLIHRRALSGVPRCLHHPTKKNARGP
jgi:hypothetical protein